MELFVYHWKRAAVMSSFHPVINLSQ